MAPGMSTPPNTAAELSLINDTEFLDELEQFKQIEDDAFDPRVGPGPADVDGYEALESGLPVQGAPDGIVEPHDFVPVDDPYDDELPGGRPAGIEKRVPLLTVVLILAVCLTAGAVTAAVVFHDRLTQITATPPASR